jgi:hypothetical protein
VEYPDPAVSRGRLDVEDRVCPVDARVPHHDVGQLDDLLVAEAGAEAVEERRVDRDRIQRPAVGVDERQLLALAQVALLEVGAERVLNPFLRQALSLSLSDSRLRSMATVLQLRRSQPEQFAELELEAALPDSSSERHPGLPNRLREQLQDLVEVVRQHRRQSDGYAGTPSHADDPRRLKTNLTAKRAVLAQPWRGRWSTASTSTTGSAWMRNGTFVGHLSRLVNQRNLSSSAPATNDSSCAYAVRWGWANTARSSQRRQTADR